MKKQFIGKATLLALALASTLAHATTYQLLQATPGMVATSQSVATPQPAPLLTLSSASVTLSSALKGTAAAPQTVTVTNTGTADLTISQTSLSGANAADFSVSGCPSVVSAGTSCTLTLGFTPSGTSTETATVTVVSNASTKTLSLTGQNTGAVDPYLANVTFLSHMDTSAFADIKGNTVTNTGAVAFSASAAKFGTGGAAFNGTNRLSASSSSAFTFGTGDFTVEASVYYTSAPGTNANCGNIIGEGGLWQLCPAPTYLGWWNAAYGSTQTIGYTFTTNTWYTIAVSRNSGTLRFYVNGTLIGSASDATNMSSTGAVSIGNVPGNGQPLPGYVDEVRITKGVGRYTGNSYTVGVSPNQ